MELLQTVMQNVLYGSISTSMDGFTWTPKVSGFSVSCNSVIYGNNTWVVVGNGSSNTIAYSTDSSNWSGLGISIFSIMGNEVAFGNNIFVAVGSGTNSIAYSNTTGTTWTGLGTTIFEYYGNGITWTGAYFVAVGSDSFNSIAYSSSGTLWTGLGRSVFNIGNKINWNGNQLVASGLANNSIVYVGSGTNTLAYSNYLSNPNYTTGFGTTIFSVSGNAVIYNGNNLWIALGQGTNTVAVSLTNGKNWLGLGTSIFSNSGNGITYNGTYVVAVGNDNLITIYYSSSGLSWTGIGRCIFYSGNSVSAGSGTNMVASGDSRQIYIVVGGTTNTISMSIGGFTLWFGNGTTVFSTSGNAIANSGTIWVALGQGVNTVAYSNINSVSSWTGLGTTIFGLSGNAIIWNGSKFIAVGSCNYNTIAYSTNGSTWTGVGTTNLYIGNAITFNPNNGYLVAGGSRIYNISFLGATTFSYSTGSTINGVYSLGNTLFSNYGFDITNNGQLGTWIAVGGKGSSIKM